MESPQPFVSTYDRDKLIRYVHIPSAFLRHFGGILEILVYLLMLSNVLLVIANCYFQNQEAALAYPIVFGMLSHDSAVKYNKGIYKEGYWTAGYFLTCMLIWTIGFVYVVPSKTIFALLTVTSVLLQNVAIFLLMYIKANYFITPVKPYAPLPGFQLVERKHYDNCSLVVLRCRAHEIILDNFTDEDVDLSRALLKRRNDFLPYDWEIRLPPGTIIQANSYLQIVPWGPDDVFLCQIGLRSDSTERRMQRLFYPTTKKSFQVNESEDHLIQTSLVTTDGKETYLYEMWKLPYSDKNPAVFV